MQNCDTSFQRGTPQRRGIRIRKSTGKLPTNSRQLMKKVQSQQFYDQIIDLPLDQVYEAIAPTPMEELNEAFGIEDDDVQLLPTNRTSKHKFSKVKKGKAPYVVRSKQLRSKMKNALTVIDKFFSR